MTQRRRRTWAFTSESNLEAGMVKSRCELTDQQLQLLHVVLSTSNQGIDEWPGCKAYALYVTEELNALSDARFDPFWTRLSISTPLSSADALAFAVKFAQVFTVALRPGSSLDEMLEILLAKYNLSLKTLGDSAGKDARRIAFYTLLTLTTFIKPTLSITQSDFTIEIPQKTAGFRDCQSIDSARRPIANLLRGYGHLLPSFEHVTREIENSESTFIRVSSLNYASLKMMSKVNIEWTPVLTCHLVFRPMSRTLMLYKFPTFCAIHAISKEDLVFDNALNEYYPQHSKDVSVHARFRREMLLSYRILFGQSKPARNLYQATEGNRGFEKAGQNDPLLDILCGLKFGKQLRALPTNLWPDSCRSFEGHLLEQEVYSASIDFPVLGSRLLALQAFNLRQQPSRMRDLWQDRRNPLQWYTFWAVLVIGGLTVIIAILQLLVALAQLGVAFRPDDGN